MTEKPGIICVGAMLWDVIGHSPVRLKPGEDVAGLIHQRPGGVALNVAVALARHGLAPAILSAVARDGPGEGLITETHRLGVATDWLWRDGPKPTDLYMAIETPDGLFAAIADAHGLEAAGTAILSPLENGTLGSSVVPWEGTLVVDGNLTQDTLAIMAEAPFLSRAFLRIVPASPDKAERLVPLLNHPNAIFHINLAEAEALAGRPLDGAIEAAEAIAALGAARVLVTDGPRSAAEAARGLPTIIQTPPCVEARHVTGAGDAFLATHLAAELAGASREQALDQAIQAATKHITAHPVTRKDIA
ncbi:PfkB family carbohydrate kinase [Paracoccus sp. MBLB3053]|uniref:PfkB family carbohydrate kinase n=1 Tax=Paracoccus aurantius TaxID=3073814 RepID=A0ABU2HSW6_9RHOB|nr:PfkB family carbohydrate kinase [Paracoccus sp. MBLB3053]MDS9468103.1 PfkB family carbohydrate kinase [Paracoccus sp. MBLB3053]